MVHPTNDCYRCHSIRRTWWSPTSYRRLGDSDVPYAPNLNKVKYPTAAAARTACNLSPDCRAYTSTGWLKAHAGCEWGSDWCIYPHGFTEYPAAAGVELYIKTGAAPPPEWSDAIARGTLLYSQVLHAYSFVSDKSVSSSSTQASANRTTIISNPVRCHYCLSIAARARHMYDA